ncbi:unnamed protein product, partial [Adineta steineri]
MINPNVDDNENDNSNFLYDELESAFEIDEYQTTSLPFASYFKSFDDDENNSGSVLDIKRSYISFILNLREQMLLPKSITNMISNYIISLIEHIQILSEKNGCFSYTDCSQTSATSFQTRTKVIECEQLKNILNSICESIDSISKNEYQLIKTCQEYFGYTPPEEIIISSVDEDVERAYFIPFERSLSLMLYSKPFLVEILREVQQQRMAAEIDQDLMYSIRDAYYGNKLDEETLLIQLYLDDISLTNPIGPKRDNHKMIYRRNSMKPENFLACVIFIFEDKMKAKQFLQPIIDNLNQLQFHGLVIKGDHLKFSVSTLIADNLAAHLVGGFQTCFSNGYFCRRCYIKYDDRNLTIPLSEINSRMINDHDDLVHELLQSPGKAPLKGVIGPSLFDTLIGFHPTTSLPSDCMHDFLGG